MQSAIKTCLAVAMLAASVEALDIERRRRPRPGRGRGGDLCDADDLADIVTAMEGYDYDGPDDQATIISTFQAAIAAVDCATIEAGETASKDAKTAKCVAWCELKDSDGDDDCATKCDRS